MVLSNIPRGWLWGPQRPAPIPADAPRVTWDDLIAMAEGIPRKHPIDDLRVWVDARALTDLSTEARLPCERTAAIGLAAPHPEVRLWSCRKLSGSGRTAGLQVDVRIPRPPDDAKALPPLPAALAQFLAAALAKPRGLAVLVAAADYVVAPEAASAAEAARADLPPSTRWAEAYGAGLPPESLKELLLATLKAHGWTWRKGAAGFSGYGPWQSAVLSLRTPDHNELSLAVDNSSVNGVSATLYFRGMRAEASFDVHGGDKRPLPDAIATVAARTRHLAASWGAALARVYGPAPRWFDPGTDPQKSHLVIATPPG